MRVLILDPYYPAVLDEHYARRPELAAESYDVQWHALMDRSFGTADAYSHYLGVLGHGAHEVVTNCEPLQRAWSREHAPRLAALPWRFASPAILSAQVDWFASDVVYVQSMGAFRPGLLRRLRRGRRLLAGQVASEAPSVRLVKEYDVVFTSFPHFIGRLAAPTELLRIGFDERIGSRVRVDAAHDVVFVGQLGRQQHAGGNAVLAAAAEHITIDVWGPGIDEWPSTSPLRARHHGVAWGIEMYNVLAGARIALNRHVDAAEGHANNMRLFEATGVGAFLLTDERSDLAELFDPEREVVTYSSAADLVDKARWYLEHDDERRAIALAGQRRTLSDHTYAARMRDLANALVRRLEREA